MEGREIMEGRENKPSIYNFDAAPKNRKRLRETDAISSDDLFFLIQEQMRKEIDKVIGHQIEKIRSSLTVQQQLLQRQIVGSMAAAATKRIKALNDEIKRIWMLNYVMEAHIRALWHDNQVWRDLAQSNQVSVAILQANMEHAMAAQSRVHEDQEDNTNDGQSGCYGDNFALYKEQLAIVRVCRSCGEGEVSVVLLPCRHLCVCTACGPVIHECPICRCTKYDNLAINIV